MHINQGENMDKSAIIKALRDGAQSASNGIANTVVGEPVDILAAGLEYAGVPVGNEPVGGTQWLKNKGIVAPVDPGAAQVIGQGLGMAAGSVPFMPAQYLRQFIK